jgi:hypothetical protein
MYQGLRFLARTTVLTAAALWAVGCTESLSPGRPSPGVPLFDVVANGITLDQYNSAFNEQNQTFLVKGFNPQNPHVGDAIIATFFWLGSTNIIDSVTDHFTMTGFPRIGNRYTLVEYVTANGISMATYVATNVQGFPDAYNNARQDSIVAVMANLSTTVSDGGVVLSSWRGVHTVSALGAHRSASGVGSSPTVAAPGAIAVGAGSLAYGVTMSNVVVGLGEPAGFTPVTNGADPFMKGEAEYAVPANASSLNPQWTWFFDQDSRCAPSSPCTWLATVLALNPAPTSTTGDLTVTTNTSGLSLDLDGYTVTVDGGQSQAIGTNGRATFTGLDAGDHTVVLSGVAVNCTVSGGDMRTVNVPSGGTGSTTFGVACVPGPATQLVFTVQPSNTAPNTAISPAVKVNVVDAQNNTVTTFTGPVTIAVGRNGSILIPGTLSGTKTVSPINGVATFSDLKIDQSGDGYTLRVTATGLTGAESARFNIRALICTLGVCV